MRCAASTSQQRRSPPAIGATTAGTGSVTSVTRYWRTRRCGIAPVSCCSGVGRAGPGRGLLAATLRPGAPGEHSYRAPTGDPLFHSLRRQTTTPFRCVRGDLLGLSHRAVGDDAGAAPAALLRAKDIALSPISPAASTQSRPVDGWHVGRVRRGFRGRRSLPHGRRWCRPASRRPVCRCG